MDSSDIAIWIVFLLGAPVLLYWLWRGNRQRRARWRAWCEAQRWQIVVDRERQIESTDPDAFPPFPIGPQHLRHAGIDLGCTGRHVDTDAASWEWRMAGRFATSGGRRRATGNTLHAVALRLPATSASRFYLLPGAMGLLSMSGYLDLPDLGSGVVPHKAAWRCHAADADDARAWLRANSHSFARDAAPDLALLQIEDGWIVAWYLGETKPERITPALEWLSGFAADVSRGVEDHA